MIKIALRRKASRLLLALATAVGITAVVAPSQASASAQTCISASGGYVCANVVGSGTWVSQAGVSRGKATSICNYSAWFFYVPPGGGAYDLGYRSRQGCNWERAWFDVPVNRNFPRGTLVCAKWMEDYGVKIAEKCVGIS